MRSSRRTTRTSSSPGSCSALARRLDPSRRRLLDVGAHAGRFISLARKEGWAAEGLELNPRTAAYAARRTGAIVRQLNVHEVDESTAGFDAITVTDVLEHIPDPVRVLDARGEAACSGRMDGSQSALRARAVAEGAMARADCFPGIGRPSRTISCTSTTSRRAPSASRWSGPASATLSSRLARPNFQPDPVGGGRGLSIEPAWIAPCRADCCPVDVHLPVTLNLQAYARRS